MKKMIKKLKSSKIFGKVLFCFTILTVLCSLLVVPSSAVSALLKGTYVFSDFPMNTTTDFDFHVPFGTVLFTSAGEEFSGIYYSNKSGDFPVLEYYGVSGDSLAVFDSGEWKSSEFQTLEFVMDYTPDDITVYENFLTLFNYSGEPVLPAEGIYYEIFEILQKTFFGNVVLTPEQNLTLTFISTVGSLFVVAIPFIVVFLLLKFIRFI